MPNDDALALERQTNTALAAHIGRLTADFVRADLLARAHEERADALAQALAEAHARIDTLTARLALTGASPAADDRLIDP